MNVGIVVPGFSASEKDWCIPALLSLVARLSERHRVRVFALRYPVRGLARIFLMRRALAAIQREHRREPFDVLHAIWADEPGYLAVRSGRTLGIPSVVTLFGGELVEIPEIGYGGLQSRWNRLFVARALGGASRVTVGASSMAALVRRPTEMLPIGVDLDRFRPGERVPGLLAGEPSLLHVASLVPVKDQATLLRAVARVPGATLIVVGEGPLEGTLKALSRELGIEDRVVFHGAVDHDALPRYYRSADLVVMSSLHEGQGLVPLEAAACGRTTVGTSVGVIRDLEPGTVAVSPADPEALAGAIREALSNPEHLREREDFVRTTVGEKYSVSRTVSDLESLFEQVQRASDASACCASGASPARSADESPSSWGWGPTSLDQRKHHD
jgi:glycosyltransferase involved in cell wall biosynthesis